MARKGNEVINLTDDDYESKGGGKRAPAGTYLFRIHKDSKLKDMASGTGVEVRLELIGPKKAKKYFGVFVFDNIAPTVTWKIGQILRALGKKVKNITMAKFLKLIAGEEIRASIRIRNDEEYGKQNKVNQYLPADEDADAASMDDDEEDGDELDEDDLDEDDDEDEEDEDEDEDDDEDDEDEEDEDEDEDEEDDDDDDEDEEDEDEDEDEEDDEEDEKPARRRPAAKKGGRKTAAKRGRGK